MNQRQKTGSKTITIWRDSVAAGDDFDAPHEKNITVSSNESIESTLEKALADRYLPSIRGGEATWIVVGKKPLAVVAQQWSKPYYFVEANTRADDLIEVTNIPQLEFQYWCQVDPNEVIASIQQGKPLPDKYGRDKAK